MAKQDIESRFLKAEIIRVERIKKIRVPFENDPDLRRVLGSLSGYHSRSLMFNSRGVTR